MGVLDAVMNETGSELGISTNSSRSVLSSLLSFINQEDGGLGGFLDRFRRAGSGNVVTSWLSGNTTPVGADTVETALGHNTIERIGSKAGLSFSTAATAIALMIPRLTQRLAPGGAIPSALPSEVRSYIAAPGAAVSSGVSRATSAIDTVARPTGRRFLWPMLLALAGLLLLFWFINRGSTARRVATTTTAPAAVAFNADALVRRANDQAASALAALKPGFSARDLTSALNYQVINFAPGSATIPAANDDLLNKTATALQSAPAGTVIEIGGHTDNTGTPAANVQLSQARADAVRDYLIQQGVVPMMLVAVGYGDAKPLGSNDTEEGRFTNRRIEFNSK